MTCPRELRNPTPPDGKSQNRRFKMCCKQRQKAWCKQTTWKLRSRLAAGQRIYLMPKSFGECLRGLHLRTLWWGDASCLTILKIG